MEFGSFGMGEGQVGQGIGADTERDFQGGLPQHSVRLSEGMFWGFATRPGITSSQVLCCHKAIPSYASLCLRPQESMAEGRYVGWKISSGAPECTKRASDVVGLGSRYLQLRLPLSLRERPW